MARKKSTVPAASPDEAYLTPEAVSKRYEERIAVGTLRNWRYLKRGPPFVRMGRAVLYPLADLLKWEESQKVVYRGRT